jgi:high-affinity nickel permease
MATIDGWLEGYLDGPAGLGLIILVSLALGLRHASDPDHLAAVTTLIASEEHRKPARKAGLMGLLWGLGHGTMLLVLGLPLVLAGRHLPNLVQQAAEILIGALIVLLAAAAVAVAAWPLPYPPPHLR